jgi:chemotaxis family two-component system response regulator PixH
VKTILLVDDEYSIVEVLSHLLEEDGYSVVAAANGEEALERASQHPPDLVITDQMMPLMSGAELFAALQRIPALRQVPVILITSAPIALTRDRRWADFIVKPFEFEELARAVHRVLGDKKPGSARNRRASARHRRRFKVKLGQVVCFTTDVSPRGFATEAMRVLIAGTAVDGSIEAHGRVVAFTGRVAWSAPGDPSVNLRGRMGITFTNAARELLEFLKTP